MNWNIGLLLDYVGFFLWHMILGGMGLQIKHFRPNNFDILSHSQFFPNTKNHAKHESKQKQT